MNRLILGASLGVVLCLCATEGWSDDAAKKDKSDKKSDTKPTTPLATENHTKIGELLAVAKSTKAPGKGGTITVTVSSFTSSKGRPKESKQDLTYELTSDVVVRLLKLPPLTDEKGQKATRSPEELRKLKGNSNLPGYVAELSDIQANSVVKLTLVRVKGAPKDARPFVSRIYITGETVDAPPEKKKGK